MASSPSHLRRGCLGPRSIDHSGGTMRYGKSVICAAVFAVLSSVAAVVPAEANAPQGATGTSQTYVVLYKSSSMSSSAALAVTKAGGTIVAAYPQIGVVIATSSRSTFSTTLLK